MPGPIAGLKVIELCHVMAGPTCGLMLADMGADVIKLEKIPGGDDTRRMVPPKIGEETAAFLMMNRNKRGIAVDLKHEDGKRVLWRLLETADVVTENYRRGFMERLGFGYDALRRHNKRLIYCAVSCFGRTGPYADRGGYDLVAQGMSGLMSVTGEADDRPGGGPQKVGVPVTDIMTGMYAAVAVLAALAHREVSGRGDYIDIGMLDVQVAYLANQGMNYLLSGRPPKRAGNAHPNIQPQDVFPCRDGFLALVVGNDAQFVKFCNAVDRQLWADDPRFRRNADRVRNREALKAAVSEVFQQNDLVHWAALLDAAGVPAAPINSVPMVFDDPQVKHRQMLRHLPHPLAGSVPQIVSPMRFANAELKYDRAPPLLGEHTEQILRELGLDAEAEVGSA